MNEPNKSKPLAPDLGFSSDSGASNVDNITNDNTPSFSGTARAGSTVELHANDTLFGSTLTNNDGGWSYDVENKSSFADGSFVITATEKTTASIIQRTATRVASPGRSAHEVRNVGAFAALKDDGSVVTWGWADSGGDSSSVDLELKSGVNQIFSSKFAFAALKDDGSVITWGGRDSYSDYGGDSSSADRELKSGVNQIFSTEFGFAALKDDGSVVTWGKGVEPAYYSCGVYWNINGGGGVVINRGTTYDPRGYYNYGPNYYRGRGVVAGPNGACARGYYGRGGCVRY